jgi:hypothetical protein
MIATIYRLYLETEMTAAGLGAVEVEKLKSMERPLYAKRIYKQGGLETW